MHMRAGIRQKHIPEWLGIHTGNRFLTPVFITIILLGAHISFGILDSWQQTFLAIITAVLTEVVLGRMLSDRWPYPASAYISGISVGILIRSPLLWPFALGSLLTIMSKYVLQFRGRHLWNPSNFGVSVMFFLVPQEAAPLSIQWGNNMWAMAIIWAIGFIIIWRLKRFHICATYVGSFLLFALIRTWVTGNSFLAEAAPITGPMYQLFVLFMITDPRTTVESKKGQTVTVFAVAFVEMLFRLGEVVAAPFYALFIVGPAALLIELAVRKSGKRPDQMAIRIKLNPDENIH